MGGQPRPQVGFIVAKNYLADNEIDALNRLVAIFLEQAELRVLQRQDLTLAYWRQNIACSNSTIATYCRVRVRSNTSP